MPELPEVESLRRSLENYILNQRIRDVDVKLPKLVSGRGTKRTNKKVNGDSFCKNICGKKIIKLTRRAKNIILELDDNSVIVVHLKMTGQLVYKSINKDETVWGGHPIQDSHIELPNKHSYIIFTLENGVLYYNDVRQFGYVLYYDSIKQAIEDGHFKDLGLEPLSDEFTLVEFSKLMKSKKGVLKKLFLDQKVVVGLGNIYADEVCFDSGVRPQRKVETLKKSEIEKLFYSIKKILPKAVELGGSSIADYLLADGSRGNYAREHKVYNRGGKECFKCGKELNKIVLAGRTTVFCSSDQK